MEVVMPNRAYRAIHMIAGCSACREGIFRFERLTDPLMELCPECDAPVRVAILKELAPTIGAMDPRLAADPIYMSQFVERGDPNPRANPKNYVSGPHSWRRMVDQKQREGFRVLSNNEIGDVRSPREIKRAEREKDREPGN